MLFKQYYGKPQFKMQISALRWFDFDWKR